MIGDAHTTSDTVAQFREAAEAAIDAIIFADASGHITYANPAAAALTGRERTEIVGRPITVLMPPEYRAAHEEGFARHLRTGSRRVIGQTVELAAQHKDGSVIPIELSLSEGGSGEARFFTAIIRDIGARKAAEAALAHSTTFLEQTVELAGVGTWEWDVAHDQVTWSDELYRVFGVYPESFPASYAAYLERVHRDDRARVDAVVREAYATGKSSAFEHRIVRPDGAERTLACRAAVVQDDRGKPVRMVGIAQDVTSRTA